MIDIDHFKRVNDNFGHLIGDEVLFPLACLLRGGFRIHDRLYRFGGEEFAVLMRCENEACAALALQRFRGSMEKSPMRRGDQGKWQSHISLRAAVTSAEISVPLRT